VASTYASAKWAWGLCDRCGFRRKLSTLKADIVDLRPTGLRVCAECWDLDNPQLQLGTIIVDDPQSLFDPRPDLDRQTSTSYFGWAPVGNPLTNIQCELGTVTVLIV